MFGRRLCESYNEKKVKGASRVPRDFISNKIHFKTTQQDTGESVISPKKICHYILQTRTW